MLAALAAAVLCIAAFAALASMASLDVGKDSARMTVREEYIEGNGRDKVVAIPIRGAIFDESEEGIFGVRRSMVERVVRQLRQAAADENVRAVVLCVDSPGGGVTASDIIWNEVRKLKQAGGGKKVVVHMGDLCASGGYYISAPADWIIASPTTITGSIGVIMMHLDVSELMERKLGIKEQAIKSGPMKDMLSPMRPMSDEEKRILQELIDSMYSRFVRIVAEGRKGRGNIPADIEGAITAVRKIADGRIYTADQAEKNGMVDGIGYFEDAVAKAKELAGLTEATVVRYGERKGIFDLLSGDAASLVSVNAGLRLDVGDLSRRLTPRLEYRWVPAPLGN